MANLRGDLDPIHLGRDDVPGDELAVTRLADGRAVLIPRALRDLQGEALEVVADLQHAAAEIGRLQDRLDELVPAARELGVSWNSIGWCVGIAAQSAQGRWGAAAPGS